MYYLFQPNDFIMKNKTFLLLPLGIIFGYIMDNFTSKSQQPHYPQNKNSNSKYVHLASNQSTTTTITPEEARKRYFAFSRNSRCDSLAYTLDRNTIINTLSAIMADNIIVGVRMYPALNGITKQIILVNLINVNNILKESPLDIQTIGNTANIEGIQFEMGPCPRWCDRSSQNIMFSLE
jgi:hypothetical protein